MTELGIRAGSETAAHSTMPQTCATDTAEAHALTALQTEHTHTQTHTCALDVDFELLHSSQEITAALQSAWLRMNMQVCTCTRRK